MNKPGQGFYKVLAESALRAVRLCQPLRVPASGYERWKELQLNFDAREMLGGWYKEFMIKKFIIFIFVFFPIKALALIEVDITREI